VALEVEPGLGERLFVLHDDAQAADPGVALPHLLVDAGAVEAEARVAQQVEGLAGLGHHPEPDLVGEQRLDPRDAGRAVGPEGGEEAEPVGLEAGLHGLGEVGSGGVDVGPGGHAPIVRRPP
jgi:hypothetical protein